MIFHLLLLTTLLAPFTTAEDDHFRFDAILNCNLDKPFEFGMMYWEDDFLPHNVTRYYKNSGEKSVRVIRDTDMQGDGIGNLEYELYVRIHHTCNTRNRWMSVDFYMDDIPCWKTWYIVEFEVDLTNADENKRIHPNVINRKFIYDGTKRLF